MTTIIGVDPGQKTGVSWWEVEEGRLSMGLEWSALTAVVNLWSFLDGYQRADLQGGGQVVEVAVERFQIGPRTLRASRQHDALHVTGALRFKCEQLGLVFEQYPASETKSLASDARLHEFSAYHAGRGHANDAARVALTHLARTRPRDFERLLDGTRRHG